MKRYFLLQLKRNLRIFPLAFLVMLALLLCVSLILTGISENNENSEENTKLQVAISGDTENDTMRVILAALSAFDDTRFAMELSAIPEDEAREMLRDGELSAVVVFPENFLERALHGDVDSVTFITSAGAEDIAIMLKNEVTRLITDIALACEKGTYSIAVAIRENGLPLSAGEYMNALSIDFVELIFSRSETYALEEIGVSGGVNMGQYYVSAMVVFLFMLFGVCFVTVGVKKDCSLDRILVSKDFGAGKQVISEFGAHLVSVLMLIFTLLISAGDILLATGEGGKDTFEASLSAPMLFIRAIPVLIMLAAFNILIFELSNDIISAVLLHFFTSLGLSYISGCFYPVYSLPRSLQTLSHFLPTGAAREFLEGAYTEEAKLMPLLILAMFSVLFIVLAVVLRRAKTVGQRGVTEN